MWPGDLAGDPGRRRDAASWARGASNGSLGTERLSHSLPGSPAERKPNFEVIGSAESLVGRVSQLIHLPRRPFPSRLLLLGYAVCHLHTSITDKQLP